MNPEQLLSHAEHAELIALIKQGDIRQIAAYLETHSFTSAEGEELGELMLQHDLLPLAEAMFQSLIELNPNRVAPHLGRARVLTAQNRLTEALRCFEFGLTLNPQHPAARQGSELLRLRLERVSSFPGILLNTLPKSGSVFLAKSLTQGLNLNLLLAASRVFFPQDLVFYPALAKLSEGGCLAQEHLPASALNLRMFDKYLKKWIVHLRDPRQALLSWAHHALKYGQGEMAQLVEIYLPEDLRGFLAQDFSLQLDYHITNYLPWLIDWIQGWVAAADSPRFHERILLTHYEDFVKDNEAFLLGLIDFLGIARSDFHYQAKAPAASAQHFRKGRTDEWREVFTPEQIENANALIPGHLKQRFGWGE